MAPKQLFVVVVPVDIELLTLDLNTLSIVMYPVPGPFLDSVLPPLRVQEDMGRCHVFAGKVGDTDMPSTGPGHQRWRLGHMVTHVSSRFVSSEPEAPAMCGHVSVSYVGTFPPQQGASRFALDA